MPATVNSSVLFAERRQRLAADCSADEAILVATMPQALRNGDVHHPFRAHSDFWYLTALDEADMCLLLLPDGDGGAQSILFGHPANPDTACWEGPMLGQVKARRDHHFDQAYDLKEADAVLPQLLAGRTTWHVCVAHHPLWECAVKRCRRHLRQMTPQNITLAKAGALIHPMRLIKSKTEIACMERAAAISVNAHTALMRACKPGVSEAALAGILWHHMLAGGASGPAYPHIVAAGANACTLHYQQHSSVLSAGELLLVDAGAEYAGYAADITRTMPISGTFNKHQEAIYTLVLAAQETVIGMIRPGVVWHTLQSTTVRLLTEGLKDLGILTGDVDDLIASEAYKAYYMHGVGHWLGLDVHDVGGYGKVRDVVLQPGMVLTIEPGLYLNPMRAKLLPQWHHLGVRIEDDVLVTETGCRVLTDALPKQPKDLQAILKR